MSHAAILSWTASADAAANPTLTYNMYRGTNPPGNEGATPINAAPITGTTYTDSNLQPGKYDYVVTSVLNGAESVHSNEVTAVILPAAPTGLVVEAS